MTMPTPLCPNRMQIHDIRQETPDVWTLSLINHDFYPYQPGQYALVSIKNSADTLRAYTLSSTPGLSPFITLSVRRLPDGTGSRWLTEATRVGQYLWLSAAQGDFTCANHSPADYLMLGAGCGVTPIMSMCRWLLVHRPQANLSVIINVRTPQDVIFAEEWRQLQARYPQNLQLIRMAEQELQEGFSEGRLDNAILQRVHHITDRMVMVCGPAPYMKQAESLVREMGVPADRVFKEQFHSVQEEESVAGPSLKLVTRTPLVEYRAPVGTSLLAAMEMNKVPVNAACRAGVCGSCKTRILSGDYTTSSTMTLTTEEISRGYVLACSCQLQGDIVLA